MSQAWGAVIAIGVLFFLILSTHLVSLKVG